MSTSFIEYRGFGFWSNDSFTELLIGETASAIVAQTDPAPWLGELAAHWTLQASGPFRAWMHLELDDFLNSEERRIKLRDIVQDVADKHPKSDPIHQTGILLLRLLDGQIIWDASSPLDYMVGNAAQP